MSQLLSFGSQAIPPTYCTFFLIQYIQLPDSYILTLQCIISLYLLGLRDLYLLSLCTFLLFSIEAHRLNYFSIS